VDAHRAWAEIDLDALTHNLRAIRRRAGINRRIMVVVKADAYGHGAVPVARHAVRCGIAALGVGTSSEALELRAAGISVPILVLGTVLDAELEACLRHDVHIGLHSSDRRASLQVLARRTGTLARVHLNIDTGMGRLGVLPARALDLLREIRASSHLELAGVMTHISSAEGALAAATAEQLARFAAVLDPARAEGLLSGWVHAANSAALFTGVDAYDTVRPGIAAYGALASHLPGAEQLLQVMSLRSQVVFLKDVAAGTPIGYDSAWRARSRTRIATLPLGYNDGVPWRPAGVGAVLLRGARAPIVGRVSMDYTTIDVGHIPDVRVGDVVTLFGTDGSASLSLEEVARSNETIPYQLTCSVGKRVTRVYHGGGNIELPGQAPKLRRPAPAPPAREELPERR
jgi:alanine racemase